MNEITVTETRRWAREETLNEHGGFSTLLAGEMKPWETESTSHDLFPGGVAAGCSNAGTRERAAERMAEAVDPNWLVVKKNIKPTSCSCARTHTHAHKREQLS